MGEEAAAAAVVSVLESRLVTSVSYLVCLETINTFLSRRGWQEGGVVVNRRTGAIFRSNGRWLNIGVVVVRRESSWSGGYLTSRWVRDYSTAGREIRIIRRASPIKNLNLLRPLGLYLTVTEILR